jgi:microcompartment protein CcmL/EutN
MPKYRVQIEVSDLEELRKLLFPSEERRGRIGIYGAHIVKAKSAVTTACHQVLRCRMDVALTIIEGVLEDLAAIMQTTPYVEEEEEVKRAMEIINELAEKLHRDHTEAVRHCCKWMGRVKCEVQCT